MYVIKILIIQTNLNCQIFGHLKHSLEFQNIAAADFCIDSSTLGKKYSSLPPSFSPQVQQYHPRADQ